MIDDEFFFIRGCLELPVIGNDEPFIRGVWASLSKESVKRCHEIWDQEGRESESPFFGWFVHIAAAVSRNDEPQDSRTYSACWHKAFH